MGPLMPWLLAATAAVAVADLVVPRPRPRRFPEDEPVSAARAEPTSASATAVLDRARRTIPIAWPSTARRAAGGRSVEELWDMAHCCDLLAVAAAAGSTVAGSVEAVGDVGDGPVASPRCATSWDRPANRWSPRCRPRRRRVRRPPPRWCALRTPNAGGHDGGSRPGSVDSRFCC